MNPDRPVHPRQQTLTAANRCYYDGAVHRQQRPHCQGVAVVAYGPTLLCATCDLMRSAVGKGTAPRPVPGAELAQLRDAAHTAAQADRLLDDAAHAARHAGASWTQIADAVGVTRQAAQQRWRQSKQPSASTNHYPDTPPTTTPGQPPLPVV